MKTIKIILLLALAIILSNSCDKEGCSPSLDQTCLEVVPTDEECRAVFQRWFYNVQTNSCEQIGYSGCNPKGFASKQDCEVCLCTTN